MSDLRRYMDKKDRHQDSLLRWARVYWKKPLKFMTLTTAKEEKFLDRKFKRLISYLRRKYIIEYLAVRTDEGNGVFHVALVSNYIPQKEIKEAWERLTGAWNVHISLEKNFTSFRKEMTHQYAVARYSHSSGFIPQGVPAYLDRLKSHFVAGHRVPAYNQFARRCRLYDDDVERAFFDTLLCLSHSTLGWCSDLRTRSVVNLWDAPDREGFERRTPPSWILARQEKADCAMKPASAERVKGSLQDTMEVFYETV
jgi:hypothetical protein